MKPVHRQAGFSLIELMCAIVILGVALVGLTQGITTALASNKESEVQTQAALLAAAQMETTRAEGLWSDGVTEGDCSVPNYQWTQTISPSDVEGLHEVTVTVQRPGSGRPLYELHTLLFDPAYPGSEEQKGPPERTRSQRRRS